MKDKCCMVEKKNKGVSLPLKKIQPPIVPKGQPKPKEYVKS